MVALFSSSPEPDLRGESVGRRSALQRNSRCTFGLGAGLLETTVMVTRTRSDWNGENLVAVVGRVAVVVVRERVTVGLDRWNVCWCSKVRTPRIHKMGRVSFSLWKVEM